MQKELFDYYFKLNDFEKARHIAAGMVSENPKNIEAWWALAHSFIALGRYEEGVNALYEVCQVQSPYFYPAVELATKVCFENSFFELGVTPARYLAKYKPNDFSAQYRCGMLCFKAYRLFSSIEPLSNAFRLNPEHFELGDTLMSALFKCAMADSAVELGEQLVILRADEENVWRRNASYRNYSSAQKEVDVSEAHKRYGALVCVERLANKQVLDNLQGRKLVLGMFSESFKKHSVSYFLEGLLENIDKSKWSLIAIKQNPGGDEFTERLCGFFDHVIEASDLSDQELVRVVKSASIDILLDLEGLMSGGRNVLFEQKLAPIYATYLGYPNTSGLPTMDYRLTDRYVDPEGVGDELYTEKLRYFRGSFLCYRASVEAPAVVARDLSAPVVFGSFNAFEKISEKCFDSWVSILRAVPSSEFLIKSASLADEQFQEFLYVKFEREGISRNRIIFSALTASTREHLQMYSRVDIHLDTFPFSGATTTFEALWQGVPTLTIAGAAHRSRVTAGVNHRLGLDEFIADSIKGYVDKAQYLAKNVREIRLKRKGLRDKMRSSELMDEKGFAKDFERLLETLIEERVHSIKQT